MESQPAPEATERLTLTQAVWETLTEIQKAVVLRTLLQVCQQLVAQWPGEVTHEPTPDPA
ncbi:MAG: hypothetical protein IT317_12750 [Anaerolineales bacterium]|nr:hypothetical protein [Anaerolineales bacterium]